MVVDDEKIDTVFREPLNNGSFPILSIDPTEIDIIRHQEIKMSAVLSTKSTGGHDFRSTARFLSLPLSQTHQPRH